MVTKKRTPKSIVPMPGSSPLHPRIEFIKSIKFGGIGMDRCVASVDRPLLAQTLEQGKQLEVDVSISQSVLEHQDSHFVVATDFNLTQRSEGSEHKIVSIDAVFSAKFNIAKPAGENLVTAFAAVEARLIFFPYLRHFVSDITYRMSIDPIVMPLTSEFEK